MPTRLPALQCPASPVGEVDFEAVSTCIARIAHMGRLPARAWLLPAGVHAVPATAITRRGARAAAPLAPAAPAAASAAAAVAMCASLAAPAARAASSPRSRQQRRQGEAPAAANAAAAPSSDLCQSHFLPSFLLFPTENLIIFEMRHVQLWLRSCLCIFSKIDCLCTL